MSEQKQNPRSGKILNVQLAYVHLLKPRSANDSGDDAKYSCVIIIPKDRTDTIKAIRECINAAYDEGVSKVWNGKAPAKSACRSPLRDGDVDRPDDPDFKNCYFINASSKTRPGIIDTKRNDLTDPVNEQEVYSGMLAHITFTMFAYDAKGNKGISCGLNNVCKCGKGTYMGGRASAESDFADELGSEFEDTTVEGDDDDWA